ncbi:helix-turn-helix domain-containing protein [Flavobacterium sp. SUN052]|uniref:helix-turn-helix domain-containing protein n=1 Tax=Flavobacterium sp. SUN052 TaxID=3002441 RepID=UPI00237D4DB1|nr:helix-turn-helix domain-containing protein [Flavobacterium sp. SUN052]MEC4005885.1 helix-turn-helix domain-containing protein [Flavobacterium sp. SUN052]
MSSNISVKRTCSFCNKLFEAKTTRTRYCSHICNQKDYKKNLKLDKIEKSNVETKNNQIGSIIDINSKDFLRVKEVAVLLNMSSKTIYRLIEQKEINAINFSTRKTLVRRKDIETYFDDNLNMIDRDNVYLQSEINWTNSYTINEAIEKFNISNGALYNLIKRFNIPKKKVGKYTLVKKDDLNIIFQ